LKANETRIAQITRIRAIREIREIRVSVLSEHVQQRVEGVDELSGARGFRALGERSGNRRRCHHGGERNRKY